MISPPGSPVVVAEAGLSGVGEKTLRLVKVGGDRGVKDCGVKDRGVEDRSLSEGIEPDMLPHSGDFCTDQSSQMVTLDSYMISSN